MSAFREAPLPDGTPGPTSMRRILAAVCLAASLPAYYRAFEFAAAAGWIVFIPGLALEVGSLLLMFFTTWGDVAEIAKAWKGAT